MCWCPFYYFERCSKKDSVEQNSVEILNNNIETGFQLQNDTFKIFITEKDIEIQLVRPTEVSDKV